MEQNQPEDGAQDMIKEEVSMSFEEIAVVYVVQADDHSAGDEHVVEYNIVAGK